MKYEQESKQKNNARKLAIEWSRFLWNCLVTTENGASDSVNSHN